MSLVQEIEKNLAAGTVVEYSEIQAELANLKDEFGSVVPDCSTKDGYEFSKNAALTCRGIRSNLESIRKEKKQPYLDYGRLIDSQAKEIKEALELIENPHKEAYQEVDNEKKRILEERKQIIFDMNNSRAWAVDQSSESIAVRIEEVECMDMSKECFGRLLDDAIAAQSMAVDVLNKCYADAVNREAEERRIEAERIELEQLRELKRQQEEKAAAEEAERQRKEQEARIALEAEERAKRESAERELRAIREKEEAELKAVEAEKSRIAAEKQAKIDTEIAAENARLAEVERQQQEQERLKAEADAREADKKHRGSVNRAAKDALIAGGITNEQAELAVKLIAMKMIPSVHIQY